MVSIKSLLPISGIEILDMNGRVVKKVYRYNSVDLSGLSDGV